MRLSGSCLETRTLCDRRRSLQISGSRLAAAAVQRCYLPLSPSPPLCVLGIFFFVFLILVPPSERFLPPTSDSDNSLLRYLSDDKILVIEEEPEGLGRESRRDSTRRSRRKSRNPSSPSFPLSPSLLSSTLRLDQPPDALPVRTLNPCLYATFFS